MTLKNLRDWVGSEGLTVENLLGLLHEALSDQSQAGMMRLDVEDYAEQCEEEGAA